MARKKTKKTAAKKKQSGTYTARFTHEERLAMVKRVEAGETQTAVSADYGISRAYVSLLWQDYLKEGEEGLKPKPMGRKRLRKLTDEEKKQIHQVVTSHDKPSEAGLKVKDDEDVWNFKTVLALIERDLGFTPGKTEFNYLLQRWRISQPRGEISEDEEDFDPEYYRYINSDVGKAVARREAEYAKKWESETAPRKRRGRPPGSKNKKDKVEGSVDLYDEDIDYTDLDAIRRELRRSGLAMRALAPKSNQRTGKHRKGSLPSPKRKKRKRKGRK